MREIMKHTEYERELIDRRNMMKGYKEEEKNEEYPVSDQDNGVLVPPIVSCKRRKKDNFFTKKV